MLDPRLLRSFVVIADTGSFTRAAERLHVTQSTISQQLARLEAAVGYALVDRTARPTRATAAGERLLGYARRILDLQQEAQIAIADPAGLASVRIGVPEDIVSSAMAKVFGTFAGHRREVQLDVTAGLSRDLMRRYRDGEFDIVVTKEAAAAPDCRASFPEPIAWFEAADTADDWTDPIPLVAFPPGGLYRDAMFERLERERRRWYVAFTSASLRNVLMAIEAGLGLSLLPVDATKGWRVRPLAEFGPEPPVVASLYSWERSGIVGELASEVLDILKRRFSKDADQVL